MAWYWFALIVGIGTPWLVMPKTLILGFSRNIRTGLTAWLGPAALTTPLMLITMWVIELWAH